MPVSANTFRIPYTDATSLEAWSCFQQSNELTSMISCYIAYDFEVVGVVSAAGMSDSCVIYGQRPRPAVSTTYPQTAPTSNQHTKIPLWP